MVYNLILSPLMFDILGSPFTASDFYFCSNVNINPWHCLLAWVCRKFASSLHKNFDDFDHITQHDTQVVQKLLILHDIYNVFVDCCPQFLAAYRATIRNALQRKWQTLDPEIALMSPSGMPLKRTTSSKHLNLSISDLQRSPASTLM